MRAFSKPRCPHTQQLLKPELKHLRLAVIFRVSTVPEIMSKRYKISILSKLKKIEKIPFFAIKNWGGGGGGDGSTYSQVNTVVSIVLFKGVTQGKHKQHQG